MTSFDSYHKINAYVPLERPCPRPAEYQSFEALRKILKYFAHTTQGHFRIVLTGFSKFFDLEVYRLANIKSAKKRILVNETKAARNKAIKSKVKTAVKKVETAIAQKDAETAKTALKAAIVEISKAGTKGVYHKNTVSRKISRLTKAVNSIA